MNENRRLMNVLLVGLLVLTIKCGDGYILCRLKLQPIEPASKGEKYIEIFLTTYETLNKDSEAKIKEFIKSEKTDIISEESLDKSLNELHFSQISIKNGKLGNF
jgi:hypothetical protein